MVTPNINITESKPDLDPVGRFISDRSRLAPPTKDECDKLFEEMLNGSDEARKELIERHIRRDTYSVAEVHEVVVFHPLCGPWLDCTFFQGQPLVWNHQIQIHVDNSAEATAGLAGTQGTVKRKEMGRSRGIANITTGAVIGCRE